MSIKFINMNPTNITSHITTNLVSHNTLSIDTSINYIRMIYKPNKKIK